MQPRDNSFSFSRNKQIFLFLSTEKSLTVEKTGGKLRKLNCKIPKQFISDSLHMENDLSGNHPVRKSPDPARPHFFPLFKGEATAYKMTVIKTSVEWKLFEKIADLVRLTPDKMKPRCPEWLLWGPLPSQRLEGQGCGFDSLGQAFLSFPLMDSRAPPAYAWSVLLAFKPPARSQKGILESFALGTGHLLLPHSKKLSIEQYYGQLLWQRRL